LTGTARPPFTPSFAATGLRGCCDLPLLRSGGPRRLHRELVSGDELKAECRQALREMRRELGADIDFPAAGRVDPDPPSVEMKLSADPARKESLGATVFCVTNNRMTDRRHVGAELVRSAGKRLKLDPGSPIASSIDNAPLRLRRQSMLGVDVHLLAASSRLLRERRVDGALVRIRNANDDSPIDLARGSTGKCLREVPGSPSGARHEQSA
jgi:hypothetical protein